MPLRVCDLMVGGQIDKRGHSAKSPWRMPLSAWRQVVSRTWQEANSDNIGLISAGVAFYGFLAILPLLAAIVLTYGIFVEPRTVISHMQALTDVLPRAAAIAVGQQLMELAAVPDEKKGFGIVVALALALFGARNGAGAIMTALNVAYEEDEKRSFIRLGITGLALTTAAVLAAIAAALAIASSATVVRRAAELGQVAAAATSAASYAVLTLAGAGAAALLYRIGPSRRPAKWTWLTPGSLFCAVAWLALTFGFGAYARYVGKFDATYGSLGAVAALLTWLYLASYILLLGAELNSELEHQTAQDTTTGQPKPLGRRDAWVADHVAGGPDDQAGAESSDVPVSSRRSVAPAPIKAVPNVDVDKRIPHDKAPLIMASFAGVGLATAMIGAGRLITSLMRRR